MTLRLIRPALAALLTAALASAAAAAPAGPAPADPKKADSPAEKVRKALDEVTDVAIENQPLALAIQQLGEQAKINFVIDTFQIQNQLGIDLQGAVVNVKLTGVKLRSALRTLLSQHNLGYAVIGDTVVITGEEMAIQRQMKQRVNVDVEKQPVEKALKQLGKETGTNLLLDSRVTKEAQAPVSLQVDDVPLETAVKLLAHMAGLRTVRVGNVVFVTNKETAAEMRQDSDINPNQPVPTPGGFERLLFNGQLGGAGLGFAVPAQPVAPQVVPLPDPPAEKVPDDKPKP